MKKINLLKYDYEVYYSQNHKCFALYDYLVGDFVCHFWDINTLKNIIKTNNIDYKKIYFNLSFKEFIKLNFR